MESTIFSPAGILLPRFPVGDEGWKKWSVIACDQFTSEKEYWEKVKEIAGSDPSALNLILPEAFLQTPMEEAHRQSIRKSMAKLPELMREFPDALIYVERTLPGGSVRKGLVGKLDLEKYDYAKGKASAIRPTEATVLERIPPRMKIRSESDYELPHVMVFCSAGNALTGAAEARKTELTKLYDFDLMLGGGHLTGYLLSGEAKRETLAAVEAYEASFTGPDALIYAVGDGNHSLAAAKAHYEAHKGEPGYENARYALCEIVDIADEAIEFEPIYRIVRNCDPNELLSVLSENAQSGKQNCTQQVKAICKAGEKIFSLRPTHALTVGTLQNLIDAFLASHPGAECDYIHGVDSLKSLANAENTVGFLFDGMKKSELFPYIGQKQNGVLPRKTFSMGSSYSKRYYTEVRKIR